MESNEETVPRPLPAWMSIPIILLCLGGGGWIIHWYVMTDSLSEESRLLGDAPPVQQARATGWNFFGAAVRDLRDGRFTLRANKAIATANLVDGKHNLRLTYTNYNGQFPGSDIKTLDAARLLIQGGDKAKLTAMKVTDDQIKKLRGLAQPPEVAATPQQREEILVAFNVWHSASNDPDRQQATDRLRQVVDDVATKSVVATKLQIADRAKKTNEIITPEQWKLDADMGGGK